MKLEVVKKNEDGTLDLRCCKPSCNGVRTNAPAQFQYYSTPCDGCLAEFSKPWKDDELSEVELVKAEQRQMGLLALD